VEVNCGDLGDYNVWKLVYDQQEQVHDSGTEGCASTYDRSRKYVPFMTSLIIVTVILLLVSAALATTSGEDGKIEMVDPKDPTKTIYVEEKYPGESQWYISIPSMS